MNQVEAENAATQVEHSYAETEQKVNTRPP